MLSHVVIEYTMTNEIITDQPAGANVKKNPTISIHGDKNIESKMVPNIHLSAFFDGISK